MSEKKLERDYRFSDIPVETLQDIDDGVQAGNVLASEGNDKLSGVNNRLDTTNTTLSNNTGLLEEIRDKIDGGGGGGAVDLQPVIDAVDAVNTSVGAVKGVVDDVNTTAEKIKVYTSINNSIVNRLNNIITSLSNLDGTTVAQETLLQEILDELKKKITSLAPFKMVLGRYSRSENDIIANPLEDGADIGLFNMHFGTTYNDWSAVEGGKFYANALLLNEDGDVVAVVPAEEFWDFYLSFSYEGIHSSSKWYTQRFRCEFNVDPNEKVLLLTPQYGWIYNNYFPDGSTTLPQSVTIAVLIYKF